MTLLILSFFSCIGDDYYAAVEESISSPELKLSFVIPNAVVATRAEERYEDGSDFENQIDITNHDFRIYFFSYSENDTNGGTLLAGFTPTRTTLSISGDVTSYTVTGVLPDTLLTVNGNFRVVVLANWGSYPEVEEGTTTIDDLTEDSDCSTFLAQDKFSLDADNLIPFYGVQEYNDVSFTSGESTTLREPVRLLRALAKVEVIMSEYSYIDTFDDVSIVNYNSQGYCAPAGVYSSDGYNADDYSSIGPDDDDWSSVFVDNLHLYGGANDEDSKTQLFTKVNTEGKDTLRIYVPEYDNITNAGEENDDFSYITVTVNGTDYPIYFAEYDEDGKTNNSVVSNRYNLKRNNLYRFYVIVNEASEESITVRVYVKPWTLLTAEEFEF